MPEENTIELDTLVQFFEDSEDESRDARAISERSRDYYDNVQLTAAEKKVLQQRAQPEIVFNLTAQNVDFLLGQERQSRTDPRAFPRTPEHDDAADAATDAIRFVCDNNDFDMVASDAFENRYIEGTGGASVEAKRKGDEIEVTINHIRWDRFFADPYSLKKDYSDARYTGVVVWKDLEEAKARWPEAADQLAAGIDMANDSDTYDDKPVHWWDRRRRRVMCVDIYFIHKQKWHHAIYARNTWLVKTELSKYLDEDGLPENPHKMRSFKVKRDGQRYGGVEGLIPIQDELNKRRSKALHIMNTQKTFSKEGQIQKIDQFKKEANKPDGHLEFPNMGEFGKDFGILPNESLVGPHFEFYQDAKSMFQVVQANAALQGNTEASLSGRAIQSLQQGGLVELMSLYDGHAQWKKDIYRAVWNRIKQFWREEKWIRVTDDENNLRFVGLNQPITIAEANIAQQAGIEPHKVKEQFPLELQQLIAQNPALGQIAQTQNDVAEMDVDIIIEEVPDTVNLQSEQFEALVSLYQANPQEIDFKDIVEMSTLRNKDKILKRELEPEEQQQVEAAQAEQKEIADLEKASAQAEMEAKLAKASKDLADAEAQRIENEAIKKGLVAIGA